MKLDGYERKAIIELLKSIGRFVWFSFLGILAAALTMLATSGEIAAITITLAGFSVNAGVLVAGAVSLTVKAIDRYIHENKNIDSNGIAPNGLQG